MSFIELVPAVKELERVDKFRLMQFLVLELAREEGMPLLTADAEYPIYTPLNAFEAGDALLNLLEQHNQVPA
jgi:hypothetical protein